MNGRIYNLLALSLCYPAPDSLENAKELEAELIKIDKKYFDLLHPYIDYLQNESRESLEESYTNTFDIQAVCPLEVGYTLFGEDYKRGEFLVRMSDLHKEYNTSLISSELGDYLPNVLMLLSKMPDEPFTKEFIEKLILPALAKMLKNFDDRKILNPFSRPLRVMNELLLTSYKMNSKILEARYE